jgi:hypothetical protein
MRTLRASLVGTVILALLGGLGQVALAWSDGGNSGGFTLEIIEPIDDEPRAETLGRDRDLAEDFGGDRVDRVVASDPRLSGIWTYIRNLRHTTRGTPAEFGVSVQSVRVENEGGTWLGRREGFRVAGEPFEYGTDWTVLEGQDGYEGLTAIVVPGEDREEYDGVGVIFDFEMPTMPDLPAD